MKRRWKKISLPKWNFKKLRWNHHFFTDRKVGQKYGLLFTGVLVLFVLSLLITILSMNGVLKESRAVDEKSDASIEIVEVASIFKQKSIIISDILTEQHPTTTVEDYRAEGDAFLTSVEMIEAELETEEQQKIYEKVLDYNDQMDQLFFDEIIPKTAEYRDNGERVDIFVQTDLHKKTTTLRNYTIDELMELKELMLSERRALQDNMQKQSTITMFVVVALVVFVLVSSIVILVVVNRRMSNRFANLALFAKRLEDGDLTVERIEAEGKDEIAVIQNAMNQMADHLQRSIVRLLETTETVTNMSKTLRENAEETTDVNTQITTTMVDIANGSEEQVQTVQKSTEIMEEMKKSWAEVTTTIQEAIRLSKETKQEIENGTDDVTDTVEQMDVVKRQVDEIATIIDSLSEHSSKISSIVDMIHSISSQTNLLALNATIEAARAGEYGKGFAVVADEVRKLAEQTADATENIQSLIATSIEDTGQAVEVMEMSTESVNQGVEKVKKVGPVFDHLSGSIQTLNNHNQQVSQMIDITNDKIDQVSAATTNIQEISEKSAESIEQIAAGSEQQNAAMQQLLASSQELASMAHELEETFAKFKV
ncbi:methyl-accepting chemotaxis protein [Gracilibacillus suaedae]|uniref:methyl-accepting chemotaxis protein n=1 Tax=Gracilibacillus suaedae TaxID=2820273 RepID=UPI001ABEA0FF|nr:methyl-accepting chemotaxis protein [Gracilibacillus suaedae]